MSLLGYLREEFHWFPRIDPAACRADLQCLNFCPHEVFEWNPQTGRPFVAHPLRCLPGCEICLEGCDTGAISLPTPQEFQVTLKRLRERQAKPQSSPHL